MSSTPKRSMHSLCCWNSSAEAHTTLMSQRLLAELCARCHPKKLTARSDIFLQQQKCLHAAAQLLRAGRCGGGGRWRARWLCGLVSC